jgi:hypothetical protein
VITAWDTIVNFLSSKLQLEATSVSETGDDRQQSFDRMSLDGADQAPTPGKVISPPPPPPSI